MNRGSVNLAKEYTREDALQRARIYRSQGHQCTVHDAGVQINDPTPQAVEHAPITYRGVTPVRVNANLWKVDISDGSNYMAVTAESPTAVLQKLFDPQMAIATPQIRAFVEKCPPVVMAAPVATPAPQPSAATGPRKILRPGDQTATLPPREIVSSPRISPVINEYKVFEQSCTTLALKDRLKNDQGFRNWYQGTGALTFETTKQQ